MNINSNGKSRIKQLVLVPVLMGALALIPASRVTAQTVTNLYSFQITGANATFTITTNGSGAYPVAGLILSGTTLYGTTSSGGTNGTGTVFAVNTDGTGFTVLHTFGALVSGTNSDGAYPAAGLLQDGDSLYGTAQNGGSSGTGTVFTLRNDGLYFSNLHNFTALSAPFGGTNSDGANPAGGLILGEYVTLYGTAQNGGTNGRGTVFAITTSFTTLHTFTADTNVNNSDGAYPIGGLLLSDNILYGTTSGGGIWGNGAVFALDADGADYTNLYSFSAFSPHYFNNSDGSQPYGGLVISNNTLFGTTQSGGTNNGGTVFAVSTFGTGFTNLYSFTGYSDGSNPYAGLAILGNTLYGTAGNGGDSYDGTLFSLTTNGADFTTLHAFTNSPGDGGSPHAALIISDNTLYGTTQGGGTNGSGMVFSLPLAPPLVVPPLQLTVGSSGYSSNSIVLSWPTNYPGVYLQRTVNLGSGEGGWVTYTLVEPPIISNGLYIVTFPITSSQQGFYRLSSQ